MEKVTFVLAEPAYIVQRGIIAVVEQFQEAEVLKTVHSLERLKSCMKELHPHFLLLNPALLTPEQLAHPDCYLPINPTVQVVAISDGIQPLERQFFTEVLNLNDSKMVVYDKIDGLIHRIIDPQREENAQALSDREKDILQLVALGKTNKEIAEQLFISPHTVITHRKNITRKLAIKTVSGLTVYAILHKLIRMEDLN